MVQRTRIILPLILLACLFGSPAWSQDAGNAQKELVFYQKGKTAAVSLFASSGQPEVAKALKVWKDLLYRPVYPAKLQVVSAAKPEFTGSDAVMAFETENSAPIAKEIGLDLGKFKDSREEAHWLVAKEWNGKPLVLVVGKTEKGVYAGALQLLSKVAVYGAPTTAEKITFPILAEWRQPFFRGREATLGPTSRCMKGMPWIMKRTNFEFWDKETLARYPRYLKMCGFNSIQLMELLMYHYRCHGDKVREKVAPALQTLSDAARQEGMTVTLYSWGTGHPPQTPLPGPYGKYFDHVQTHWADPGPGGYAVPQEATTALWNEWKKQNPQIKATVDVWGNDDFFKGDPRMKEFLDETFSPKDIGIALGIRMGGGYNQNNVDLIRKSGRRVGLWMWYSCDYEYESKAPRDLSFLRTKLIDRFFQNLPEKAGIDVDWISADKCHHGLPSEICQYVAGQKMWDPKRPLRHIMLDYCRAVYGPQHAELLCRVYELAEDGQVPISKNDAVQPPKPNIRKDPEFRKKVREALNELNAFNAAGCHPRIPTMDSPQGHVENLKTALKDILAESTE